MLIFGWLDVLLLILFSLISYTEVEVVHKHARWIRPVLAAAMASLLWLISAIIEAAFRGNL